MSRQSFELDSDRDDDGPDCCDCTCSSKAKLTAAVAIAVVAIILALPGLTLSGLSYSAIKGMPCVDPTDTNQDGSHNTDDCLLDPSIVGDFTLLETANSNVVLNTAANFANKANTSNPAIKTSATSRYISLGSRGTEAMRVATDTGQVAVGTSVAAASALLTMSSTTLGFLLPRMNTTQKQAIASPATGLLVFDTTLVKLSVYNGTAWRTVTDV